MYRKTRYFGSSLTSIDKLEGEPIEHKIERIMENKEPISDGAPSIFTERKDGVVSAYNIRTDRFEIACEAMDKVSGSIQARRDNAGKKKEEPKVIDLKADGGKSDGQSVQGE